MTDTKGDNGADVVAMTYAQAVERAIAEEMRRDDDVFFLATATPPGGLLDEFGARRIRRTPISENGFTGAAVGAAVRGLRPIVWWRTAAFSLVAFDQVVNHAAKLHYMTGGQVRVPMVMRATSGAGNQSAAQHAASMHSIYAHAPGLKVVMPSCASDALGLMKAAIRDDNPVVVLEPLRCQSQVENVPVSETAPIPLGTGRFARQGTTITVVALGYMVQVAVAAAEILARDGIEVEIIDPRTVTPLDIEMIRRSVQKTGRLIATDDAPPMCSFTSEVLAVVGEHADTFACLRAPMRRVCGADAPTAFNIALEALATPSVDDLVTAITQVVGAER
ncbi:MAG: transketolase C-terminal domain-containing protein [Nitriliruptoraceae bacterium]